MLEITHNLSSQTCDNVIQHLESTLKQSLKADVSNYAPGRMRVWLQHEAPLSDNQNFQSGTQDTKLWTWCKEVAKESGMKEIPEVGLAIYGDRGIKLHRDASFAAPEAVSINLGAVEFLYDPTRGFSDNLESHILDRGEVMLFDSKHRHAAVEPASNRWCIVLWSLSDKIQEKFNAYRGV